MASRAGVEPARGRLNRRLLWPLSYLDERDKPGTREGPGRQFVVRLEVPVSNRP
jgi:hypothetical protein